MDKQEKKLYGVVVFYEPNYSNKTIKEISRTSILSYSDALDVYANTRNPASQLVKGHDKQEINEALKQLEEDIKDPKWLKDLFDCI